jgi:hypothetical protein
MGSHSAVRSLSVEGPGSAAYESLRLYSSKGPLIEPKAAAQPSR